MGGAIGGLSRFINMHQYYLGGISQRPNLPLFERPFGNPH